MPRGKGCVFVDACNEAAARTLWSGVALEGLVGSFEVVPLHNGPSLSKTVRRAARSGAFSMFLNFCSGSSESEDGASALDVARLLQALNVPYTGCRPRYLGHSLSDTNMMAHYCGIKLPPFALLKSSEDVERACAALKFPVVVRGNWPTVHGPDAGASSVPLADGAALRSFCSEALNELSELLVRETPPPDAADISEYFVLAVAGAAGAVRMVGPWCHVSNSLLPASHPMFAKCLAAARGVAHNVIGGHGYAMLHLQSRGADVLELLSVQPNCAVSERWFTEDSFTFAAFVTEQIDVARSVFSSSQPTFVVSFDAAMKGYFMRAARDLSKGEIVFHDERRNFPIVTKGFVESNFSEEDKVTFSEYGWPLDSDGHVYAIWEDDPRTWRPINHSCDPNLIFAAKHSLNVIASRDIKKGEDLTMDYAAFCDFTMKPFNCFCKTACCRGVIRPDAVSLAKYTVNAWHRRQPEGFVPQ